MSKGPTPEDLRAKIFEDRQTPGNWRVEKLDEDGGYEVVKVFSGVTRRSGMPSLMPRENLGSTT